MYSYKPYKSILYGIFVPNWILKLPQGCINPEFIKVLDKQRITYL